MFIWFVLDDPCSLLSRTRFSSVSEHIMKNIPTNVNKPLKDTRHLFGTSVTAQVPKKYVF